MILKIFAVLSLLLCEVLSCYTAWTTWFGSGMKDSLASILMVIPIIALAIIAISLMSWAFGDIFIKKFWWLLIPSLAVIIDVILKLVR